MSFVGVLFCLLIVVAIAVLVGIVINRRPQPSASRASRHDHPPRAGRTRRQLATAIDAVDRSIVQGRLLTDHGWDFARVKAALTSYRQFLFLVAANPGEPVVPWHPDIDTVWQVHSQCTSYADDCRSVFGGWTWPYRPAAHRHPAGLQRSRTLYDQTFSVDVPIVDNTLLELWLLSEMLNDPTPITDAPYAGLGGEFGGAGASGDWNPTDTGASIDDLVHAACDSDVRLNDTADSHHDHDAGGYDSGDYDSGGGDSGGGDSGGGD